MLFKSKFSNVFVISLSCHVLTIMCFWNNFLSLFIGGKYLYFLSLQVLFFFRCLENDKFKKVAKEKFSTLEEKQKPPPPRQSSLHCFYIYSERFELSSLWYNFVRTDARFVSYIYKLKFF